MPSSTNSADPGRSARLVARGCIGCRGFTLVELIVTILILGILAVVIIPRLDSHDFDTLRFYDQALAAVRYAQKVAVAQRTEVFVVAGASSLSVCFNAGCANPVIPVGDPSTGSPLVISAPPGVTLAMSPGNFSFIGLGSTSGVTSPVVVTVSGIPARSFTVEQETGYVHR